VLPRDKVVLNNGTIEQLGTAANLLLSSQPGSMIKCAPVGPEQVTCTGCGWVHMAYTRAEAQREVDDFNAWFVQQTDETKASYGGKQSRVEDYEGCDRCGRKVFRPSKPDDAPIGCTIGPVIYDPAAEEADRRFGQPHYGHDA
jgi:ribosomal protein L37E